jgi:hypothetical protein
MMMMNKDQFTIVELMYILDKMDYYEMSSGYIGETPDGKIEVFPPDEDHCCDGVFVTTFTLRKKLNKQLQENEL